MVGKSHHILGDRMKEVNGLLGMKQFVASMSRNKYAISKTIPQA